MRLLVDTVSWTQGYKDEDPLIRELAKPININEPGLTRKGGWTLGCQLLCVAWYKVVYLSAHCLRALL